MLDKIKLTLDDENKNEKQKLETQHGMSYLEMKYNLMLNYCQFLSAYLLMKLECRDDISEHPIIERLTYIKLMFEKLRPLD